MYWAYSLWKAENVSVTELQVLLHWLIYCNHLNESMISYSMLANNLFDISREVKNVTIKQLRINLYIHCRKLPHDNNYRH